MKRSVRTLALVIFVVFEGHSYAQCLVEGRVNLPAAQLPIAPPPRYAGQVGEIAPPDPPAAVVYLEGQFPNAVATPTQITNQVLQLGLQFRPALLPVQVGTFVKFPNGDDFYHSVFSYSKAKRFDLGRYRKEDRPPPTVVFDKPGVVKLYCEIHQHMRGVVLVLQTPYFTRTTNNVYELHNLPAGNYMLKAWMDETHVAEKPVTLQPGRPEHVDFDLR